MDLTPNLQKNPVQVDLLGSANQCILAQLGSTGMQPGSYQQIRILLGGGRVAVSNNKCGSSINLRDAHQLPARPQRSRPGNP